MEGIVKLVNEDTGFFVVETDNGFSVFETADLADIEQGDVIVGHLDSTACERVMNDSKQEVLDVYVRDIVTSLAAAEALLSGE